MHNVQAGDALMLCSDGLWSAVTEEQIVHIVSTMPAQQACEALVRLADEAAGDENISVVMLSFSSLAQRPPYKNRRNALSSEGGVRS
jgi:protein phosphatase